MKKIYYWKVQIPDIKKELIVYAYNKLQCKQITDAWLKKQNLSAQYNLSRPFAIKKNTPLDIVIRECNYLCLETIN